MMGEVMSETQSYVKVDPAQSSAEAKEEQYLLENVTLNIAITGESGVGKSSFVNAMRGLGNGDYGAAETGVTETTMKAIRYNHPTMPNVYIWDLPGIGTPNFKAKKYLKEVQFDSYDFFIIIGSFRFKENDMMLAKEIKKLKKSFYFVRSKIDQDVHAETQKKNVTEEQILTKIRLNCRENLASVGNPKVFLISTMDLGKYDFQKLVNSLNDDLSDHKWSALAALPVCSLSMIGTKKRDLQKRARVAAEAAATSVHNLYIFLFLGLFSEGVDETVVARMFLTKGMLVAKMFHTKGMLVAKTVEAMFGIMVKFLKKALIAFGLNKKSIRALAVRVNKRQSQLKSVMKSRFSEGVDEAVVARMFLTKGMLVAKMFHTKGMLVAKTVEAILFDVPALSMRIAFATTFQLLSQAIKEMAEDAKAVILAAVL